MKLGLAIMPLLLYMPDMDYKNDPEVMEDMMPWSERVQYECKK